MTLELGLGPSSPPVDDETRALGVFAGAQAATGDLEGADLLDWHGFSGGLGETLRRDGTDGGEILVGLGPRDRLDLEALRRIGAALARAGARRRALLVSLAGLDTAGFGERAVACAIAEGAALASYRYADYKSDHDEDALARIGIVGDDADAVAAGVGDARLLAEAVGLARDLVNTPGSDLTPVRFAEIAAGVAADERLGIEVLDEDAIATAGLGGIMAVARGSAQPPRLVRLTYEPEGGTGEEPTVFLVGKGITFDSGGLAIKPIASMMAMKTDMSGAAAVLGTLSVCRRAGIAVRVVGLMPLSENMSGGNAVKPGDVLRARNGKTIEVLNPDAEGRLVLADGLSLAVEERPDAIIDLATLTGACVQALGNRIAGVMGNDDRLIEAVRGASARAGEPTWPLPIPTGYRDHIDSDIADMKNLGTGQAGAISAALLLEEFVDDVPWVHLDIAGPARSAEDGGYMKKGGTGFGVRTLIELLRTYAALGGSVEGRAEGKVVFW